MRLYPMRLTPLYSNKSEGACGAKVTVLENGDSKTCSNHGRNCLHFTKLRKIYESYKFLLLCVNSIVEQIGLFNLGVATSLGEAKSIILTSWTRLKNWPWIKKPALAEELDKSIYAQIRISLSIYIYIYIYIYIVVMLTKERNGERKKGWWKNIYI